MQYPGPPSLLAVQASGTNRCLAYPNSSSSVLGISPFVLPCSHQSLPHACFTGSGSCLSGKDPPTGPVLSQPNPPSKASPSELSTPILCVMMPRADRVGPPYLLATQPRGWPAAAELSFPQASPRLHQLLGQASSRYLVCGRWEFPLGRGSRQGLMMPGPNNFLPRKAYPLKNRTIAWNRKRVFYCFRFQNPTELIKLLLKSLCETSNERIPEFKRALLTKQQQFIVLKTQKLSMVFPIVVTVLIIIQYFY